MMPVMIGLFSYSFLGLVLYWVISNAFSIGQQALISRKYPISSQGGHK